MANIKSAKKRILQTERQRQRNQGIRTRMRTAVKKLRTVVEQGDAERAQELLPETLSLVDRTVKKKVVHANAGARTKSRLVKAVRKLSA